jgi:hypothetical protein
MSQADVSMMSQVPGKMLQADVSMMSQASWHDVTASWQNVTGFRILSQASWHDATASWQNVTGFRILSQASWHDATGFLALCHRLHSQQTLRSPTMFHLDL